MSGHSHVRNGLPVILIAGWVCLACAIRAQEPSPGALPPAIQTMIDTTAPIAEPVVLRIAPPALLAAVDAPNDAGKAIDLSWTVSPDDRVDGGVTAYRVYRSKEEGNGFVRIAELAAGTVAYSDRVQQEDSAEEEAPPPDAAAPAVPTADESHPFEIGVPYYYRVAAVDTTGYEAFSATAGPVRSIPQWYHSGKTPVLVLVLVFFVLVVVLIQMAKIRGADMYIRPIAGISEIDNAIGRATEMGRPILYVMGLGAPEEIATIASYTILARVARKTAEYRTNLLVPCNEPIVMTIAQETVKNAYMEAGHPDLYSDNMVFFVTSMQFAYVAAVNGLMLRERTATNCYFGKFYAESLLLSEAGNIAGSIQVAGTDEVAQLPFFVTTCDYTLIGEELYAASAYLGRDPLLLGALKAQDYIKAIVMLVIFLGVILISFGNEIILNLVTVNL